MKFPNKQDIEWVCGAAFGRHSNPEFFVKTLTMHEFAEVIITIWEAGKIPNCTIVKESLIAKECVAGK